MTTATLILLLQLASTVSESVVKKYRHMPKRVFFDRDRVR